MGDMDLMYKKVIVVENTNLIFFSYEKKLGCLFMIALVPFLCQFSMLKYLRNMYEKLPCFIIKAC